MQASNQKEFLKRRSLLDVASPYITGVVVPIAVLGALALIVEYGFAPDESQRYVLHIIEMLAVIALAMQPVVSALFARPVIGYVREHWYQYALLALFAAAMAIIHLSETAQGQLWM
ncbi:MAG: hypothetical protein QGD94_08695, partial [Planctomycetia bacterium]|nr:hypothetical protein [Planctomycetia bacterium]